MVDLGFRYPFALTALGQLASTLLGERRGRVFGRDILCERWLIQDAMRTAP